MFLLAAGTLLGLAGSARADSSVGSVLWQPSMNVFRRFEVEPEAMFEFYGEVLGFERLGRFNVGNGGLVRFQVGNSELKFTGQVPDRSYVPGGMGAATGLRLWTFFFDDAAALKQSFEEHGLPAPDFSTLSGRYSALVQDPDGQTVELVIVEAGATDHPALELGLHVSDMEQSVAFYRDFVGLEELQPRHDDRFGVAKRPFRHGTTVISLFAFEGQVPADTGSSGIQYVVSNVDLIDAEARANGIGIDQPLSQLAGFDLRTIWLDDPDGITNYFAETAQAREARAQ
jgi:catechol 2,3-dioxygenase-like lactoylglutathione lyase family enzyme